MNFHAAEIAAQSRERNKKEYKNSERKRRFRLHFASLRLIHDATFNNTECARGQARFSENLI